MIHLLVKENGIYLIQEMPENKLTPPQPEWYHDHLDYSIACTVYSEYQQLVQSSKDSSIWVQDQKLAEKLIYGQHGMIDNRPVNYYQWKEEYFKKDVIYPVSGWRYDTLESLPPKAVLIEEDTSSGEKSVNPDKEHFDKMLLKELVWKLDREVWAHVPNPEPSEEWSTSKAREESRKLISEYIGDYDSIKSELSNLREALKGIANSCDPENPSHETIWRIADSAIKK